jgi:outer membrane protein assembly factor BamB
VIRRARWFPLGILTAALAFQLWLWLLSDEIRQMQVIYTYATLLLGGVALLVWWVGAGARSRRTRWLPVLVLMGAVTLFLAAYRVKGITGDWIPVVESRLARRASPEAGATTASTPREAGADASAAPAGDGSSDAEGFPRFLGPRGDSSLRGVSLSRDWSTKPPRLLWKRPVGAGWSGFAIANGRAFTLEQRGELETAVAYDLEDGNEVWTQGDRAFFTNPMAGPGPRATPTIQGPFVFTFGSTGLLTAYRAATGKRLWQHDVPAEHHAKIPEHGMTGSPLAVDGLVVVSAGGARGHSLVAYDQISGRPAWHGGDDGAGYASPILATLAGRRQILVFNRSTVAGHDPRDGAVLWSHAWPPAWPNVATPLVVDGDRVLYSTGYGVGSKVLRVHPSRGGLAAELQWESPRLKSKFANLALYDGFVYGLDDGVLVCLDPATGERRWKGGRYGHGNLIMVGDLLLVQTEAGDVVLVEPTPEEHRELGRFTALPGKAWNPLALAGGLLLVRNDGEAALWALPLAP